MLTSRYIDFPAKKIIGTHWGVIYITDFEGNEVKKFASHSATVNSVSFDESCEYIASASDDGKFLPFEPLPPLIDLIRKSDYQLLVQ